MTSNAETPNTVTLNRKEIHALPPAPPGKRVTYFLASPRATEQVPTGFVLIVTDRGAKTYYVQRRINGSQRRVFIERAQNITPADALKQAWKITAAITEGRDPAAERKAARAQREAAKASTLSAYWQLYSRAHVARLSPRTQEAYTALWTRHIEPALGSTPLSEITRADVRRLHADVQAEALAALKRRRRAGDGGRTANMVVNLLRAILNDAIDSEVFPGPNPAQRVKKAREQRRERYLSFEEIGRLYSALEADARERGDWLWHDLVKLLLLTGARRGNVMAMRWEDVSLEERVWRIPSESTKTREMYLVALEPGAVEILRRRLAEAKARAQLRLEGDRDGDQAAPEISPWVFPGRGESGHVAEIKNVWPRIRDRAGLRDVRPHDLRHTHASLLAANGVSLQMIGAQLGHKSPATTARYAHLSHGAVQAAVEHAFAQIGDQAAEGDNREVEK